MRGDPFVSPGDVSPVGWGGESGGGSGTPGIAHRRLSLEGAMSLFEEFVKMPDVLEALRGLRFGSERAWDDAHSLSDVAVRRVLLLGDIHDSSRVFEAALEAAIAEGCDVLVQVGDFWLQDSTWRGFVPEEAALMWAAVNSPIPVVVVDGNHEVWPCLVNFLHRADTLAALRHRRPLHLGGSLWWADRGSVWTWANRRFAALGGSASPDRWIRQLAPYRWPEETTTQHDLDRLINNTPHGLDVLICHDAPADTQGLVSGLDYQMPTDIEREAKAVRELLQAAVDSARPSLVFHGHWHQQNRCRINNDVTEVFGLAADGHPGCAAVLSISRLEATYIDIFGGPIQGRLGL